MKRAIAAIVLASMFAAAFAHEQARHRASAEMEETSFGRTGNPKKVTLTIRVDMSDRMRFEPSTIALKQGDTVRFVVRNSGKQMHEMVLGTLQELEEHAALMRKHPGMEHDEPYMAHVAPGKTVAIVWQFTKTGEFHYGCLIPGHFEAGMKGTIKVIRH